MKTDAEWKQYEREQEAKRAAAREAAQEKWAARVKEIEAGIYAALKALDVKCTKSGGHWKIGAESPIAISVAYTAVARTGGFSRFSKSNWGGISRVQVDGYGGNVFHESKAAAKKLSSTRDSDFDYGEIAAHMKWLHGRRIAEDVAAKKKDDARTRGNAAMRRLGGRKVFGDVERPFWPNSDAFIGDGITISYDVNAPSYELEFKIAVTALSEERAKTILDFLKSLPVEKKS